MVANRRVSFVKSERLREVLVTFNARWYVSAGIPVELILIAILRQARDSGAQCEMGETKQRARRRTLLQHSPHRFESVHRSVTRRKIDVGLGSRQISCHEFDRKILSILLEVDEIKRRHGLHWLNGLHSQLLGNDEDGWIGSWGHARNWRWIR